MVAAYDPAKTTSVLWHAGGSAVSVAGIQLSQAAHEFYEEKAIHGPLKVFATSRTQEKCEVCVQQLGCTGAINTATSAAWDADIRGMNQGEVDIIFDFVGAPYFQSNLNLLARDGVLVSLGLMGGPMVNGPLDISPIVLRRARIEGTTLRSRSLEYQITLRDLFVKKVLPHIISGRFQHLVEVAFPWEEISKAHQMLETNKNTGKVVCTIDM
jgi:NADPH:quinone reductase-like Zn-dependent oxidoreductase